MKIITKIEIKNFRSIKNCTISDIEDFNSLFGLNNSGKSNILRALNLFFNYKTDDNQDLDFEFDFHQYPLKQKKKKEKKEIKIAITFQLPNNFTFKKKLKTVEDFIFRKKRNKNKKIVKIEKIFGREYLFPERIRINDTSIKSEKDAKNIDLFLSLINFRYIPNRVLPLDTLKNERNALRKAITRKLNMQKTDKKKIQKATKALSDIIKNISKSLIQPISNELEKISNTNITVELITPSLVEDLISTSGYFFSTNNIKVKDIYQGSGIQSFLMFHTLHLIDKDYAQQFGWKQATIWAVEEPESSLHSDLEAQLAMFLFKTVIKSGSRLQFFCTTHSTMFAQYSQKSVIIEKDSAETICRSIESKDIHTETGRLGISQYTHPLLYFPNQNILLCEGKTDVIFLKKIFEILDLNEQNICITCLADLTDKQSNGGIDTIAKYIKENKEIIELRNKSTKIFILLDWETKENKYKHLEKFQGVLVFQWPSDKVKEITRHLKGIESLYPKRFFDEAFKDEQFKNYLSKDGYGNYTYPKGIERENNNKLKQHLSKKIKSDLSRKDISHIENFIKDLIVRYK